MARYIEVLLEKRQVRCVGRLLDQDAPRTCEAVWRALPQQGDVFHAKYASHEIYALVAPLVDEEPGPENQTIVPAAGDIVYFYFSPGVALPREVQHLAAAGRGVVDLAVFYDRNNLLFSPTVGPTPGNVFAVIVRNLEAMREAGRSVWREGAVGERLVYRRLTDVQLKEWGLDSQGSAQPHTGQSGPV